MERGGVYGLFDTRTYCPLLPRIVSLPAHAHVGEIVCVKRSESEPPHGGRAVAAVGRRLRTMTPIAVAAAPPSRSLSRAPSVQTRRTVRPSLQRVSGTLSET